MSRHKEVSAADIAQEAQGVSDSELVRAMAAGDTKALAEIYERHGPFIRRVLVRYCSGLPRADVADLMQEVFIAAFQAAGRYRDDGKFRGWLAAIAFRKAQHERSLKGRRYWLLEKFGFAPKSAPQAPDEAAMTSDSLEKALAKLPEAQRQVLLLHTVEGMGDEEIASALGIAVKTVSTRLHRARATLHEQLHGDGGDV